MCAIFASLISSSHRGLGSAAPRGDFRDRSARAEPNQVTCSPTGSQADQSRCPGMESGLTNILREDCMHSTYIDAFTLGLYRRDVGSVRPKMLRGRRFSAVAVLVGLGLLFTAAGARASCFAPSPYKAGAAPAITYVSLHADGEWNENATIVGLWHVLYTATSDDNFPPGGPFPPTPFTFLESFKTWHRDGTEFENAFVPPAGGKYLLRRLEGPG
jgi:hypothetical protein